jgi:hypothetical protein
MVMTVNFILRAQMASAAAAPVAARNRAELCSSDAPFSLDSVSSWRCCSWSSVSIQKELACGTAADAGNFEFASPRRTAERLSKERANRASSPFDCSMAERLAFTLTGS